MTPLEERNGGTAAEETAQRGSADAAGGGVAGEEDAAGACGGGVIREAIKRNDGGEVAGNCGSGVAREEGARDCSADAGSCGPGIAGKEIGVRGDANRERSRVDGRSDEVSAPVARNSIAKLVSVSATCAVIWMPPPTWVRFAAAVVWFPRSNGARDRVATVIPVPKK